MACSPRHPWCGHVKAGDTRRKTAQIMLKWRACCLLPARRANGWRRRKPLIPKERRTAWRSCAGQRKHDEYFVCCQQLLPKSRYIRVARDPDKIGNGTKPSTSPVAPGILARRGREDPGAQEFCHRRITAALST